MVAATHREQPRPPGQAARAIVLQRHLDRHLNRDTARVAEKDTLETGRREIHQPLREPHRTLVRETAKHHVGKPAELLRERRLDPGMAIAMDGRPPRGHTVDHLAAVVQPQTHAFRALHPKERRGLGGGVGMPDDTAVAFDE